jgi:hypothetical protein
MATRRPDLEAEPFRFPRALSQIVYPPKTVMQKVGDYYYADVQSEGTVQTDRTLGEAATATTITGASQSFNLAAGDEFIQRKKIPESERDLLGGLEKAELAASRITKRSVMKALELLTSANVLAGAGVDTDDIENDLIGTVATNVDLVMDVAEGEIAMVMSSRVFNTIKKYDEVLERMKVTGVMLRDIKDVRNISREQLAAIFGVDRILIGRNAEWYNASATYQQRAGIMVLPDKDLDVLEEIQAGRFIVFPVGDDPADWFMCESYHSDDLTSDIVQTRVWAELHLLNPETQKILTGIDPDNASSTTTTTSTTTA